MIMKQINESGKVKWENNKSAEKDVEMTHF